MCVHTLTTNRSTRHELLLSRLTFSISHRDGIFSHSCNVRTSVLRNTYLPHARRVQTIAILCKRKYWIVLLADLYTYNTQQTIRVLLLCLLMGVKTRGGKRLDFGSSTHEKETLSRDLSFLTGNASSRLWRFFFFNCLCIGNGCVSEKASAHFWKLGMSEASNVRAC